MLTNSLHAIVIHLMKSQNTKVSAVAINQVFQNRNEYRSGSEEYLMNLSDHEQECLGLTDAEMKKKIKEKK